MSDTYDPDERFSLAEEPEDVLRRLLGAEEDEEQAEGEEDDS
jgi:hypothetical protein